MASTPIAVAVVEHAGQILIGRRGPGVPLSGLWEFPGGKLLPGESPAAAAVRECREETGLSVDVCGEYPLVEHRYEPAAGDAAQAAFVVRLHFFACRPRDPAAAVAAPFRWVPREELGNYEFPAANRSLVAELTRPAHAAPEEC